MPPNRLQEQMQARATSQYQEMVETQYAKVKQALGKLHNNKDFKIFLEFERKLLQQIIAKPIDETNPNLATLLLTRLRLNEFFTTRDKAIQGALHGKK